MKIKLYHGSEKIIKKPIYGYGNVYNDYGMAFYCTKDVSLAKEWAVEEHRNGFCNVYNLEMDDLTVLDLSSDDYCILHWITVLLQNRVFDCQTDFAKEAKAFLLEHYNVPYEEYDVIKGYRADDSYFSFAQDFINNAISVNTLSRAMKLGKLGEQIAIKSEKAFDKISFVEAEMVEAKCYYPLKSNRDKTARSSYRELRKEPWSRGNIYMMQILEEEIKESDERIR